MLMMHHHHTDRVDWLCMNNQMWQNASANAQTHNTETNVVKLSQQSYSQSAGLNIGRFVSVHSLGADWQSTIQKCGIISVMCVRFRHWQSVQFLRVRSPHVSWSDTTTCNVSQFLLLGTPSRVTHNSQPADYTVTGTYVQYSSNAAAVLLLHLNCRKTQTSSHRAAARDEQKGGSDEYD